MAILFANGRVFDPVEGSRPGAVAVRDGRILGIGSVSQMRQMLGSTFDEVDVAGGLISPSFTDAHLHPIMGGVEQSLCNLVPASSAEDCFDIVSKFAASHPEAAWIVGGGWRMDLFPGGMPTRQALDRIVADRPVVLRSTDRHSAWVNSMAMEIVGLDSRTTDPVGGRIERDADGTPSGVLHEAAIMLVESAAPDPTLDEYYRGLLYAQDHCLSLGITGWQDAMVHIDGSGLDALDVYERALERGTLRAKVTAALGWDRKRGTEQIVDLVTRRARMEQWLPQFDAGSVKIILDGIVESFTASLSSPYRDACGHTTSNSGIDFIEHRDLPAITRALDAAGFQIHFHALGDRAVTGALDALEGLPSSGRRHHLAHLQIVRPSDIRRFSAVQATANLQPLWAQNEPQMLELTLPFLPPELVDMQYPFEALRQSGAHLAAGSDWPVSSADPLEGIHVAVNRSSPETHSNGAFLPHQSLRLLDIWHAYTVGSAEVNHRDAPLFSAGSAADIIVLDRDPFEAPSEEIGESCVASTWVEGKLAWNRTGT